VVAGVQAGRGRVGAVVGSSDQRRARELSCGESSSGYWLTKDRQSRAAADPERFAAEQAESEEIKRLRRRVAELEVEREILKRSAAWWAKESMP
jgi:transposase